MTKPAQRSAARLAAVQALYQMDVSGTGVIEALAEFEAFWIGREVEGVQFEPAEASFFRDILGGVVREGQVGQWRARRAVLGVHRATLAVLHQRRDHENDPGNGKHADDNERSDARKAHGAGSRMVRPRVGKQGSP